MPGHRTTSRARRVLPLAALLAALSATPARALDLATARPPQEVLDHQVTSGPRTLVLPEGRWFLVDHEARPVGGAAPINAGPVDVATLVQVEDGAFMLGARVWLLRGDFRSPTWNPAPCAATGDSDLYLNERSSVLGQVDCVAAWGELGRGVPQTLGMSKPTLRWLAAQRVRLPDVVSLKVARYVTNTFGFVFLVAPVQRFDSNAALIAWSETLRDALKPLFEHRVDEGRLPPMPPSPAASAP